MKKSILSKLIAGICTALASVMVFSVAACNTDDGGRKLPAGESHGLTLISYTLEVDAGATAPLIVTSALMEDVVWTTSDTSIATVEGEGDFNMACTISAHSVGIATITATSGELWATCTVGVNEPETILITKGGYVEDEISLSGMNDTAQLSASSSRKHNIVWESSKPLIATVSENGLVTAKASSGTVDIIAKCAQHSNVTSSITVKVGDGVDSSYTLENSFVNTKIEGTTGTWYYWNEFPNVEDAKNVEGVVSFKAKDLKEGAYWYNVQLKYGATSADKDEDGKSLKSGGLYALSFDLDISMAGHITVNGYVLEVQEGKHRYTIWYKHNFGFEMSLGVDGMGCDLVEQDFTVEVSNLSWKVDQPVQLVAPTFSIDNQNKITINDTNTQGVGSYTLKLYNGNGDWVRSVLVEDGQTIDMNKVPKGTYSAQLVANAKCEPYVTAPETQATSNNTVVSTTETADLKYGIVYGGEGAALIEAGSWTYWSSAWVTFVTEKNGGESYDGVSGKVIGDKAHISFSNNAGFWYDTQLWYVLPGNSTKTHTVTLHIENLPVVEGGAVTVNGTAYDVTSAATIIPLELKEGASIEIAFGKNGQTDKMPIQNAEGVVVYLEISEKAA